LGEVKHSTVKPLISAMSEAGLSAGTIDVDFRLVKRVVASYEDEQGEPIFVRRWSPEFLDLPIIEQHSLNRPCFDEETVNMLARWRFPRERMFFILAAASGGRANELLGLDICQHISPDFSTLRIERQVSRGRIVDCVKTLASYREIDLHFSVARVLKRFVGTRTSGLLFSTSKETPLNLTNILSVHLHPALRELGYINSCTGKTLAGTHAFRRFRNTQLGKCPGLPESLQKYWMGHRDPSMTGKYDKFADDREFRKMWAQRCGIGFELPIDCAAPDSLEGDFEIYS
jgi:integrase